MNSVAIVVTAYKIPDVVICRFLSENPYNIILVSDSKYATTKCPEMDIFSIAKTSNIGIRKAVQDGFDVIVKTDIDCILTSDFMDYCKNLNIGNGASFRHWNIQSCQSYDNAELDPRCMGTAVMHAESWCDLNGYNENMFGYGYDDGDIFERAIKIISMELLTEPKVYHIAHEKHNQDINPLNREYNYLNRRNYVNSEWGLY